jgi:hypothetical protein
MFVNPTRQESAQVEPLGELTLKGVASTSDQPGKSWMI